MIGVHVFGCNTDYDAQSELWQPAHDEDVRAGFAPSHAPACGSLWLFGQALNLSVARVLCSLWLSTTVQIRSSLMSG